MYQNISVAIAPFHPNGTQKAIELAKTLRSEGGTITLLTVMEPIPGFVNQYLPSDQLEHNREQLEANLREDAQGISNVKITTIDSKESAGPTIIEHANKHNIDLIIIASHRPGLQDYFLGSTAARVVRHAPCAVHVVR